MRRCEFACARHRPKLLFWSVAPPLSAPNCVRLSRLNVSQRKSRRLSSLNAILLASEKFSLKFGQPRSFGLYLVSLPNCVVGCAPKNETGWKKLSALGSNLPPDVDPRQPS